MKNSIRLQTWVDIVFVSKVEVTVRLFQEVQNVTKNLHSIVFVMLRHTSHYSIKVGVVIIIIFYVGLDRTRGIPLHSARFRNCSKANKH